MSEPVKYCPECRAEYRDGFVTCSDCDVPLVRRLQSEVGDHLIALAREQSFEFVADIVDALENQNVPYVIEAGTALPLRDNHDRIDRPAPWEARIWVATSFHERAREIYADVVTKWRLERGSTAATRYLDTIG